MNKIGSRPVWSGPRYSIIPGDFVEEPRADVNHFKVLNYVGRHTDNHGWCHLKQKTISDTIKLTRETVNRKLGDLVEWGYIEKSERNGRALYYRVIMDRGRSPDDLQTEIKNDPDASDSFMHGEHDFEFGDVRDGSHVVCNSIISMKPPITSAADVRNHISSDHTQSHITTSLTTLSNDSPPQSPARGERERGTDEVDEALLRLVAERPGDDARRFAVDIVLRPIVVSRKFDAGSFEHGLRVLADWIATKSLTEAETARIVERILDTRRASVKPSDIEDEVKAVIARRPQRAALPGNEALMARWPSVLKALNSVIDPDKVDGWFSTIVVVGISDQRVELVTHLRQVPTRVEQDFGDHLRWALSKIYGVSKFKLAHRLPGAMRAPSLVSGES